MSRLLRRLRGAAAIRSIRGRLVLLVGALLALGALNVAVIYWGSRQRDQAFSDLMRAIDRERLIVEVTDRLEDHKKFVDLLGSGVLGLGSGAAPSDEELRRFDLAVDSISVRLAGFESSGEAELDGEIGEIGEKTRELARWWKAFYANQGVDQAAAVVASVEAEPIAQELLATELPAAIEREKARVARASAAFVEADRTVSRVAWLGFLLSAAVGGLFAVMILRDVFRSIRGLTRGAEKIGAGSLDYRVEVRGEDELSEVAGSFNRMAERLLERTDEIERERRVSEDLLLNILPQQIADELRERGQVEPKYYSDATIVFVDLVGCVQLFEKHSVDRMVRLLDRLFTEFDRRVREFRLEKLKTIGDAYMCAGGLTRETAAHPVDSVLAAFAFLGAVGERADAEGVPLSVRVGIHTGPVAAGVVGIDKFAFDIWGDSVNLAARLEATGAVDGVSVSQATWLRVKDFFAGQERGAVKTKEGRALETHLITGIHPELVGDGVPPPAFVERYRIYFEHEPPAFPASLATSPASRPTREPTRR